MCVRRACFSGSACSNLKYSPIVCARLCLRICSVHTSRLRAHATRARAHVCSIPYMPRGWQIYAPNKIASQLKCVCVCANIAHILHSIITSPSSSRVVRRSHTHMLRRPYRAHPCHTHNLAQRRRARAPMKFTGALDLDVSAHCLYGLHSR